MNVQLALAFDAQFNDLAFRYNTLLEKYSALQELHNSSLVTSVDTPVPVSEKNTVVCLSEVSDNSGNAMSNPETVNVVLDAPLLVTPVISPSVRLSVVPKPALLPMSTRGRTTKPRVVIVQRNMHYLVCCRK